MLVSRRKCYSRRLREMETNKSINVVEDVDACCHALRPTDQVLPRIRWWRSIRVGFSDTYTKKTSLEIIEHAAFFERFFKLCIYDF